MSAETRAVVRGRDQAARNPDSLGMGFPVGAARSRSAGGVTVSMRRLVEWFS